MGGACHLKLSDLDFLKGRHRLGLFLLLLAMLALGALAAVWSVAGTGAYLTGEGNWQSLAGDYRIGTIDYTVKLGGSLLLGRTENGSSLEQYQLVLPILGGVKMYDPDPGLTALTRSQEFNEGTTLVRVRVANYSKSMVDVTAQFSLIDLRTPGQISAGVLPIRALPLPAALTEQAAASLDYRKYVLDTLKPFHGGAAPASLSELDDAYHAYMAQSGISLAPGLLPGALSTASSPTPPADGSAFAEDGFWIYYRDVFFVVWSEYGNGEYNVPGDTAAPRQGRFDAVFTAGQLD